MGKNTTKSALLMIDMENAFISKSSPLCNPMAEATIPACIRAVNSARGKNIPVFFVKRIYRNDGSDVELTRYKCWENGRFLGLSSKGDCSAQAPEGLRPIRGDYTIVKPRFSAFFQTELDLILRRLQVKTVILCGTATPNCIRTTAYDAISLDYNVVILPDCCSSATQEIQDANLADMERIGVQLMTGTQFESYRESSVENTAQTILEKIESSDVAPEPFSDSQSEVRSVDNW
jgi:nicotinamidase-related amidase